MAIRPPIYTPRLPGLGGGGGGIQILPPDQEKENISAIIQQALKGYLQGQELKRRRAIEERKMALEEALGQAAIADKAKSKQPSKRVVKGQRNWWLIDPYTGEKKNTGIPVGTTGPGGTPSGNIWDELIGEDTFPPGVNPRTGAPQRKFSPQGDMMGQYDGSGRLVLSEMGVRKLLEMAGGDVARAREIAMNQGWVIPQ